MKIIVNIIPAEFLPFLTNQKNQVFSMSGNEKYFCILFVASLALIHSHSEFNRLLLRNFLTCYSCSYYSSMIPVIFQHSSLTYRIPLVKNQSSFNDICSLAICINIKAFNRVNKKHLNIRKTFLDYLEFYIVAY